MRYQCWMLLSVFLLGVAAGCGDSGRAKQTATEPAAQDTSAATPAVAKTESGGPAEALTRFLEAVRTGNDEVATKMFTPLARQKVSEQGIQVAPRGSDTARFEVGKVELVGSDGARVASKWSDRNKEGQFRTDDITWMLRHETEGWRVVGMAAVVFDGEPPVLLDFEQPDETLRRLEMLEQERQRRTAKADPEGQKNPQGQQVQPAGHVAAASGNAAQPQNPVVKDDSQTRAITERQSDAAPQSGSSVPQGAEKAAQETPRTATPSDPFQR